MLFINLKPNVMKNLIYVFAVLIMGVVSCGAPAEKNTNSDTQEAATTDSTSIESNSTDSISAKEEASHDNHEGHSH